MSVPPGITTTREKPLFSLLGCAFPNLVGLLRMIPRPRWAAPVLVTLGMLASLAEAAGILLVPLFFYSMMNQLSSLLSSGGPLGLMLRVVLRWFHGSGEIAVIFLLLIVARGLIAYVYGLATAHVGEQITQSTRDRVHRLYLRLPYKYIQQHEQAELVEALGREAWLPSQAYHSLTRLLVNGAFIVMLGGLLVLFSWQLTICVFVGSVLLTSVVRLLSTRSYAIGGEVKRVHQSLWDHMMVTLQGMRTIRIFGQEGAHEKRFNATSLSARQVAIRTLQLTLLLDPLTEVGYLVILGVIVLSAPRFGVSFATTLTCVALLYRLQPHVREIEGHRLNLLQLEPQLQLVRSILQEERELAPYRKGPSVETIERGIRFEHVSFRYRSAGSPTLDDVSFDIPAGKATALVGASGSGKTTIVNLLLRLYAAETGAILIDQTQLVDLDSEDWVRTVAVAGQDVDLVDGSVLENLLMANPSASKDEVRAAADVAALSEVIDELPEGYETWVGQHGHCFSGGQRQRIGIARAVLHNPRILILDEAMSAMDLELERRVRANMERHFAGCTILFITHRLETVLAADHVVCLESGRVTAQGTASETIATRS